MANKLQIKRTTVTGRTPNTTSSGNSQYISTGELALNLTDGVLYSSDGTSLITVGSNVVNQKVTGTLTANVINVGGITTYSNAVVLNNDKSLKFQTVNSSAYATFVQQSDDNFVFYTTNTTGGQRAVFSIFANNNSGSLSFGVPVNFNGNIGTLTANGSVGSSGQLLTSNGTSVYWSSPGAASVNVAAQYNWTNTQTFTANISFTGNNISLVNGNGSIQFNGASDANWRIGRNTGTLTKNFYTNSTLDIIAGGSPLEGIIFGNASNTYMEVGANGIYTRNIISVGNSTVNLSINSTSIVGNSVTIAAANTAVFYNYNGQANAVSGNFVANAYATLGGYGGNYLAFGQQSNYAQWIQSGYSAVSPVYYNIILNPLGGNVGIGNTIPSTKLAVNGTTYLQGNVTFTQGIIDSTGSQGTAGQVLTSNGAGNVYWSSVSGGGSVNVAAQYTWTNTQTFSNTITFDSTIIGTVNNALYLGGTAASSYQLNSTLAANVSTLTSNLANYIVANSGLVSNSSGVFVNTTYIGTLSANNASYLGGTAAASYQLNSTLAANVATMAANSTTYILANTGLVSNSLGVFVNSSYIGTLSANNASYLGGVAAASYVNTSGSYTITGVHTHNANLVMGTGSLIANGSAGSANQVLTSNGTTVYWANAATGGGGASVTVSDTAPSSPGSGDLWYYSVTGDLYLYYNDGNSSQWVSTVSGSGLVSDANNASYLGGNPSSYYAPVNAPSFTGAVSLGSSIAVTGNASFSSNASFTKQVTLSNTVTITGNVTFSNVVTFTSSSISANGSVGPQGYVLTSGGPSGNVFWSPLGGNMDFGLITGSTSGATNLDYGAIA